MMPAAAVILCRPSGQNEALAARLRAAGRDVVTLPALSLTASTDAPLPSLSGIDLVMFVSGNAARFFLDRRLREEPGAVWPAQVAAATVGPGSAAAVRAHPAFGAQSELVTPPSCAAQFDSEALWNTLQARQQPLRKVLIVRGTQGRDWLAGRLRDAGVDVCIHTAYRREPAAWRPEATAVLQTLAARHAPAVWLLTSVEGVDALMAQVRAHGLAAWWLQGRFVVTHPRIAAYVTQVWHDISAAHGQGDAAIVLQTCPAGDDAVVAAIESLA